ncbi:hypothetical protein GA0115236_105120 [Streptomyces sp. IgraMP-1]|nr:hypothetical protein GA0115236_105120 [Streptomyces sp. IgraMP-1]
MWLGRVSARLARTGPGPVPGAPRCGGRGCAGPIGAGMPASDWAPGSGFLSRVRSGVVRCLVGREPRSGGGLLAETVGVRRPGTGWPGLRSAVCGLRSAVCGLRCGRWASWLGALTLGAGSGLCGEGGPSGQGERAGRAGRWVRGGAMSVWGNPCWGVTLFRFPGSPPPPSPPPSSSSAFKRPDDAPSHAASGVRRQGHRVAAMLGLPCRRPIQPRRARRAAGPTQPPARFCPAATLQGPGGAESVLSPGVPAPVLSPRRLGCPGTQVHPSRRHSLRTTATPARSRSADAPERRPRQTTQPPAPTLAPTAQACPCRPAPRPAAQLRHAAFHRGLA